MRNRWNVIERVFFRALLMAGVLAMPAGAAQTREIMWNDLLPALPELESAFATLAPEQLEDMRAHVRWVVSAPAAKEDQTFRREAEAALSRLVEQGVDVDGLMKQRRQLIRHRHDHGCRRIGFCGV